MGLSSGTRRDPIFFGIKHETCFGIRLGVVVVLFFGAGLRFVRVYVAVC